MKRRELLLSSLAFWAGMRSAGTRAAGPAKSHVLFIAVDDLNDMPAAADSATYR
jgi:hypothetical protein